MFLCLMPSYAIASVAAALVGNQIGGLRVKAARYYYFSCLIIMWISAVGICVVCEAYKLILEERLSDDNVLQEQIENVYHLFCLNIFLDSMKTMFKGFFRGLGIQNTVIPWHILFQGAVLPGIMYLFTFQVFEDKDRNMGIWISMTIVGLLLFLVYWARIHNTDWHARSMKIIKRTNKMAGTMESDTKGLDQ